jgi:hypothetical protein
MESNKDNPRDDTKKKNKNNNKNHCLMGLVLVVPVPQLGLVFPQKSQPDYYQY